MRLHYYIIFILLIFSGCSNNNNKIQNDCENFYNLIPNEIEIENHSVYGYFIPLPFEFKDGVQYKKVNNFGIDLSNGQFTGENPNFLYLKNGTINYEKNILDENGYILGKNSFTLSYLELVPNSDSYDKITYDDGIMKFKDNFIKFKINKFSLNNCNFVYLGASNVSNENLKIKKREITDIAPTAPEGEYYIETYINSNETKPQCVDYCYLGDEIVKVETKKYIQKNAILGQNYDKDYWYCICKRT